MSNRNRYPTTMTIGLDLGDESCTLCALDVDGEVVERAAIPTEASAITASFAGRAPAHVVMEATTHSPWISRLVAGLGHEVLVAHPPAAAKMLNQKHKTDENDAESLARIARLDARFLEPLEHRSEQQQADRNLILARSHLVSTRARLVHFARGVVKASGVRIAKLTTSNFGRSALEQIPDILRPALVPVLNVLVQLSQQISEMDKLIEATAKRRYPQIELLTQVNGVGVLSALAFMVTIRDPHRFTRGRVGAYLGLVPRKKQSGKSDPALSITRAGDPTVRRLLVQCAHHILGPYGKDSDLKRWGLAIAERGGRGARQRAAIAVARRLACLLNVLWKTGEVYEPLRNAQRQAALQ